jgi:hypothetical protein
MDSLVQIAGALAILGGFALAQWGVLDQRSRTYLVLNLAGAAVLAVDAYVEAQWGFFLLEGIWTLISAWSLVRLARQAEASASA